MGWRIDYFCLSGVLRSVLKNAYILPGIGVLNLLKQEKAYKRSTAGKHLSAGWNNNYLKKFCFALK
jgi:hypothetical protein